MKGTYQKTERLNIRCDKQEKMLVAVYAQKLKLTISEFMLQSTKLQMVMIDNKKCVIPPGRRTHSPDPETQKSEGASRTQQKKPNRKPQAPPKKQGNSDAKKKAPASGKARA